LRLNEVNAALENPSVWNEPKRAQELGKEKKLLETVVETIDHLASNLADNTELYEMSKAEDDIAGLAPVLADRTAPAWVFARERVSLGLIQGLATPLVRIGLDHDAAFWLHDSALLKSLRATNSEQTLLVIERGDAESATGRDDTSRLTRFKIVRSIAKRLPRSVRQRVARTAGVTQSRQSSAFGAAAASFLQSRFPQHAALPVDEADISRQSIATFDDFTARSARSAATVSTRLHAAVLAAMLGKPTFLVTGPTHKMPGIFRQSLHRYANASLIDTDFNDVSANHGRGVENAA